jgi:hypothetical protein
MIEIKRGRPQKAGVKPGWMLIRAGVVLATFEEKRRSGAKHHFTIEETVEEMRKQFPKTPISATEVKRILAAFQPSEMEEVFRVERDGQNLNLKIGAPYRYRINAKI